MAELILTRRSSLHPLARFEMRVLGRNAEGALRLKTWSGTVNRAGDVLNLHGDHCRVFGKRGVTDRLVPMERWDCDHLILRFQLEGSTLHRLHDDARHTRRSEWFWLEKISLLTLDPGAGKATGPKGRQATPSHVWAGQRMNAPAGSSHAEDVFYFGYEADRHLRPGDALLLLNDSLQPVGHARVKTVVGDFVLTEEGVPVDAPLAGTMVSHRPTGLLD